MPASSLPLPLPTDSAAARAFVAADVGGTHVRIALARCDGDGIGLQHYRKYACAEFPGLAEVIAHYLGELPVRGAVDRGVIASAGHALPDGTLLSANLPWQVSLTAVRDRLGFADFRLINDFEAVAHAVGQADTPPLLHLSGPAAAPAGPVLVVGPGTGLGAAVRIPRRDGGATVLATEAGQASLTVRDDLEMAVMREFLRRHSHVSIEHALSGPGLVRLYTALAAVRGAAPALDTPGAISAAAQAGDDALAHEALSMFCALLGGAVGDMALLYGAHGGVHLAGGVLPQIRDFLLRSAFVQRFLDKGPMREALERIPVTLVEHGQLGVLGAAGWYLGLEQDHDG